MLIQNANPRYFRAFVLNNRLQSKISAVQNTESINLNQLPSAHYGLISFSGGMSMSLADTKRQLDMHGGKYPAHIREEIEKTLAAGNPDNKTLIDIHLEQYSLLDECETLEEAQELYPEFKDVISDKDIKINKGSFLDKAKNGGIAAIDPNGDITLQLLQFYWGKGFSLNALAEECAGLSIEGTMRRLNIPRVDSLYGRYLKLSDKDYNKRFTDYMSDKLSGKTRAGRKGLPLSAEHKGKISDSLIEYYIAHPEKLTEKSAARKEYFKEHPEEGERFSVVMSRAWNYPEAQPVKKAMSDFMGRKDVISSDEILEMITEGGERNFRGFWKANEWAEDVLSKCVSMSWERQKELSRLGLIYEPLYTGSFMPKGLKHELALRLKGKISDFEEMPQFAAPDPRDKKRSPVLMKNLNEIASAAVQVLSKNELERWEKAVRKGVEKAAGEKLPAGLHFTKAYAVIIDDNITKGNFGLLKKIDRTINHIYDKN